MTRPPAPRLELQARAEEPPDHAFVPPPWLEMRRSFQQRRAWLRSLLPSTECYACSRPKREHEETR
jgi:hypothetical protein